MVDQTHYTLDRLDITNPDKVEMCWGILRPKQPEGCTIKQYILGVFYCPPNSRKKNKLITHIITNAHVLISRYPDSGLCIGGDKNSLDLAPILQGLPRCRQIVSGNTHDNKCLDVLITNLHNLYQPPRIVAACQPDDPTKAKPSDHLVPVAYPISGQSGAVPREYRIKKTRPLCESGVRELGNWLTHQDWEEMDKCDQPDGKEQLFSDLLSSKVSEIFPEKSVKLSNQDLPFINWKLKDMKRKLHRLYQKEGRRQEYETFLDKYNCEFQKTAKKYVQNNVDE